MDFITVSSVHMVKIAEISNPFLCLIRGQIKVLIAETDAFP